MVAEERITTKFSGLVGAHGSEEEANFLATQQVDEARHTVLCPVPERGHRGSRDSGVGTCGSFREQVSPASNRSSTSNWFVAHEHRSPTPAIWPQLCAVRDALSPDSGEYARFDHYRIRDRLPESTTAFPRFRRRIPKIHHDETRHTVWGLVPSASRFATAPEVAPAAVREMLREAAPSVAESPFAVPEPGGPDIEALGVDDEQIREFALGGLTRRLEIIGVPLESVF